MLCTCGQTIDFERERIGIRHCTNCATTTRNRLSDDWTSRPKRQRQTATRTKTKTPKRQQRLLYGVWQRRNLIFESNSLIDAATYRDRLSIVATIKYKIGGKTGIVTRTMLRGI